METVEKASLRGSNTYGQRSRQTAGRMWIHGMPLSGILPPARPVLFHSRAEGVKRGGFLFRVPLGAETFQPVDLASELPQAERVLQVHPEVPAPLGEICDVERGDNHGRHELSYLGAFAANPA